MLGQVIQKIMDMEGITMFSKTTVRWVTLILAFIFLLSSVGIIGTSFLDSKEVLLLHWGSEVL